MMFKDLHNMFKDLNPNFPWTDFDDLNNLLCKHIPEHKDLLISLP